MTCCNYKYLVLQLSRTLLSALHARSIFYFFEIEFVIVETLLRLVMSGRELSENLIHTHEKETEIKMLGVNTKDVFPFFKNIFVNLHEYKFITERIIVTGRTQLIRTRLIQSST